MIFAPPGHREAREANGPCTGRAARRQSEAEEERAMSYETPSCAYCPSTIRACRQGEAETRGPGFCPSKVDDEGIEAAGRAYVDPFVREVARASALVESEGYCRWTRVEETMEFARKLGIAKLGLATLEAQAEIIFPSKDGAEPLPVQSGKIILTLDSNINIGAKALYYFDDGTPIGEGPIPFRVGQPTKLKVFWDLSNDIHEMENISISAALPDNVKFTGDKYVNVGDISFDESTRKVTWAINRLPEAIKEAHGSFTIEVTPTAKDAGQIIKLTGNTTLSAKDTVTNNIIIKTKNIITSALEQDGHAKTDGVVKQ